MRNINDIKNELQETRLRVEQLEKEMIVARQDLLKYIHQDLGYSKEDLLSALEAGDKAGQKKRHGRGPRIPDEKRVKIEKALKEGYSGVHVLCLRT